MLTASKHPKHQPVPCLFALAVAVALIVLAVPPLAFASPRQLSVMEDSGRVLSADPRTQDAALDEMKALDADIVKIPVLWRAIAPDADSRRKPGVDLSNPDAYPTGAWAVIDRAVLGAELRGMQAWLMLTAPAPRWSETRESAPVPGAQNPSPDDFAEFVEAVGSRYGLVRYWSIWNEPNLSRFLQPQFKNGVAVSAIHYRKLYRAGYAALAVSGHRSHTILFGELLPRAPKPRRVNGTVPPVMWLRDFFCLDADLRPFKGAQARRRECEGFKPIKTSGFAYHPYTTPAGPLWNDPIADNATIHHLGRIYRVLDAASRTGRLAARRLKIYNSEFGFQTRPPDGRMVPLRKVPEFLNVSEYMSFEDRRMATYSQYLIHDDRALESFQSGLRYSNGRAKPGVYDAYRMPLVVIRRSPRSVLVWGKVRAGGPSPTVEIEGDLGDGYEALASVGSIPRSGYFERVVSGVDPGRVVFRLRAGRLFSRRAMAGPKPRMEP